MSRFVAFLIANLKPLAIFALLTGLAVGALAASWHGPSGTFNFQWLTNFSW